MVASSGAARPRWPHLPWERSRQAVLDILGHISSSKTAAGGWHYWRTPEAGVRGSARGEPSNLEPHRLRERTVGGAVVGPVPQRPDTAVLRHQDAAFRRGQALGDRVVLVLAVAQHH